MMNSKRTTPPELKNYPGNKSIRHLYKNIISLIPPHKYYYEPFAGSAQVWKHIRPAEESFLYDENFEVVQAWKEYLRSGDFKTFVHHASAFDVIQNMLDTDAHLLRTSYHIFMYLDPPYPIYARASKRRIYEHEMNDGEHIKLLQMLRLATWNIMISTNENSIYRDILHDWQRREFSVSYRGSVSKEIIYMNYPEPVELHDYRYFGADCWKRQQMKRKIERWKRKIQALPDIEKKLLLQQLKEL